MSFFYTAKTRNEIVCQLSFNNQLKDASKNIIKNTSTNIHEDLFQDMILSLLEMPETKILNLYQREEIIPYCLTILSNQTKKGKFGRLHIHKSRKEISVDDYDNWKDQLEDHINPTEEEREEETRLRIEKLKRKKIVKLPKKALINITPDIQSILKNHHWYDRKIFIDLYLNKNMTIREIAEKTTIPVTSIHSTIHRIVTELKADFNKKGFNDFV